MPQDDSRIPVLETKVSAIEKDIVRHRDHLASLLTFKNQAETGVAMTKWLLGFVGLSNIALILKLFMG